MKLIDLIDQFCEDEDVTLQICFDNDSWDEFDTVRWNSPLVAPFYRKTVKALTAVEKDVFRMEISEGELCD